MTGHIYRDVILEQHVRLFRGAMGAEFLFMDDNARPHRANIADDCVQSEDITRIDWPAYSPDLNPIEHVWDMLGRRIAARQPPPTCLLELRRALLDEWCNIPQDQIDNVILSIPRPLWYPDSSTSFFSSFSFLPVQSARGIESVIKRKCEVGVFADDIVHWKSNSDLMKLERDINLVLEDIRNFALDHKLTLNPTKSTARKLLSILRYISVSDWGEDAGTLRNTYISLIRTILEYGVPVYCSASVTNLQKLEKVQLSAARIITDLKITCPRDIILFEADLQPLSLRRQTKKKQSLQPKWSLLTLPLGAVEPHHLSQCLDTADDLDGVFFHPELTVHVNKQADLPAYLKQLALERIGDIPVDAVQVYTEDSRDDYYRSGSGIYIKSQDHILRIQRRNPDSCSVFRSELIAIDEALGSLVSLPNGKEIWILSDSRSAIQHLSNWQSVRDNVGVSILTKLKPLFTSHQIHLQWIPSHIDLEGNEIADTLSKDGACEVPESSAPLTFLKIFSRTKHQNKTAWIAPQSTIGISVLVLEALWLTVLQDRIKLF
ncbi:RNase H domain-containing protein [Trichonephila clavipes]|nr:RNase H domain-containing protein [Trichonephila clavipes]